MFALSYYLHCQWDKRRQALLILSYKIKSGKVIILSVTIGDVKKKKPKSISHPVTEISFK